MLIEERHNLIVELATRKGTVSKKELADTLGVSLETVRRDIGKDSENLYKKMDQFLKAEQEYETFRKIQDEYYLSDFDKEIKRIKGNKNNKRDS